MDYILKWLPKEKNIIKNYDKYFKHYYHDDIIDNLKEINYLIEIIQYEFDLIKK